MPILMFINLKGGVAKTTSAVAVAECLAAEGHRTLLIDADHQCMAGELLLGEDGQMRCERAKRTLHDLLAALLKAEFPSDRFEGYVTRKASNIGGGLPKLAVLPCSVRIDDFETNRAKARRGYATADEFKAQWAAGRKRFRKWAEANFDYTVVDCPPSVALQVKFFLAAADGYVVPCVPERLPVQGALHLMERFKRHGYKLRGLGTLWSLYREQSATHRKVVEMGARGAEQLALLPRPFKTVIPNAAKIGEANEGGGRPDTFRKKYTPPFAKLFEDLCREVVQRAEALRQNQPPAELEAVEA